MATLFFQILGLIFPELMEHPSFPYVFTVVHILVVSHTCINPFIYCWMNRRVRYGFMDVMGKEGTKELRVMILSILLK